MYMRKLDIPPSYILGVTIIEKLANWDHIQCMLRLTPCPN